MIKTIITCDRCGKDISGQAEQKWHVRVQYACDKELYMGGASSSKEVHWCRECLECTGLIPIIKNKDIPAAKMLSFEDMVREIVREEMA